MSDRPAFTDVRWTATVGMVRDANSTVPTSRSFPDNSVHSSPFAKL
ncbi:hypothetical protein ACFLQU_04235 [Verrucomicrobiota bacterium]